MPAPAPGSRSPGAARRAAADSEPAETALAALGRRPGPPMNGPGHGSGPRLPGQVYAAPYAIFEPSLAMVAQDADGVAGYIVAAFESLAFEHGLEQNWWPRLRPRYPEPPGRSGRAAVSTRTASNREHPPPVSNSAGARSFVREVRRDCILALVSITIAPRSSSAASASPRWPLPTGASSSWTSRARVKVLTWPRAGGRCWVRTNVG